MELQWLKVLDDLSGADETVSDGFAGAQISIGWLEELSEAQLREQRRHLESLQLSLDVCTAPLPQGVAVTQKGFNIYVWTEYAKKAVQRAAGFGCRKIVWSDGRSRLLPIEGDTSTARQQTLEYLAMLCDVAAKYEMRVLVEPLGPRRTNFLNSMQDIAGFIPLAGRDNLSSMISLRELDEIGLSEYDFQAYSGMIGHVQMENPRAGIGARVSPRPEDGYDYGPFLRGLRRIGYGGAITLPNDADGESLDYCKALWSQSE